MSAEVLAKPITAAIQSVIGFYLTLVGFRVLGKKLGESIKYDAWYARWGKWMRISGLFLVAFALSQAGMAFARSSISSKILHPANWQRYALSDNVCSAEFPDPPKHTTKAESGIEADGLALLLEKLDISYTITCIALPADASPATDEERLNAIRDGIPASYTKAKIKVEFVRERKFSEDRILGRELEFRAGETHTIRDKIFILNQRIYRIVVMTPNDRKDNEETSRFLNSFRFGGVKK